MNEQRAMLSAWLAGQATPQDVLREFIEEEGVTTGRPTLASAVAFCKAQRATLVIVSKGAIGCGSAFDPRIASVPLIVVPQPSTATPAVISLPANSRDEVSLYHGAVRDGGIPVYVCNPTPIALTDVTVIMSGLYTDVRHDERLVPFGADRRSFARIEPMTARLIETRNVMTVGESIDQRRVCFNQNGKAREGVAYLSTSFEPGFITMTFVATPMHDDLP